ncbi:MAG: tetratricopeptide repeat protein [Gammaproteobacteria bacterium]|nr:tetratricopeptide repeat protein [Gammaproteobacteria bacterium]
MPRFGIGIFLLAMVCIATAQADAIDAAIQAQLDSGQPEAAWNLAQQHLAEHAGEPDFDFAAGLAALEAGQPQHAVMAFERVLMVQPSHHRARLELARAYFMLGDFTSARREFQAVQTVGPPPNVLRRVDSFLAEIDLREAQGRTSVTGYLELRPGWDSNAASATADSTLVIPALGTVSLGASSLETSDRFLDKNAGITLVRPLDKRRALFADLAYRDRGYVDEHDYSSHSITLSGGLALADGRDRLKLPVQYQSFYLADDEYRRLLTLGAEWSRDLNTHNQLQVFGQIGALRYPEDATQDVNLLLAGSGWNHRYATIPLLASIAGFLGDESAQETGGDPNGRLYYGLRLGMQWSGIPEHTPYASLVWQKSRYDADSPVFLQTRDDRFAELRLGWSWQPEADWTLTAEASAIDNQSNINLYEYTRNQFSVGMRYQFD